MELLTLPASSEPEVADTVQQFERQRMLVSSRSGRRQVVVERHSCRRGREEWSDELFEVSGWLTPKAAERQRRELERAGHWLAPECLLRMREGQILQMQELRWEVR